MGKQDSPKANEDKYLMVERAWAEQAPDAVFGGMTLAQYRVRIKPSKDARDKVKKLEDELKIATEERDTADIGAMIATDLVVKGVVGDPVYGDDSSLYGGMGYIRKSERKSGLTRKKKNGGND